jgi:hypothetical protein
MPRPEYVVVLRNRGTKPSDPSERVIALAESARSTLFRVRRIRNSSIVAEFTTPDRTRSVGGARGARLASVLYEQEGGRSWLCVEGGLS